MLKDATPRWLRYPILIIFAIHLGAVYAQSPQEDPEFAKYYPLLAWRDPVSGSQLNLLIDRAAPYSIMSIQTRLAVNNSKL